MEQSVEFLRQDVQWAEVAVNRHVTVPLTQNQFDALVSFTFNVGAGAFRNSMLVRRLNAEEYHAVPEELSKWVKQAGIVLPGLVHRRRAEAEVWNSKDYDPTPKCFLADTPIQMADGSERPIQDILPGDVVIAFDAKAHGGLGGRKPARVTRTFRNTARQIINLRGLRMTPGHVVLSDSGEWLKISDVLRQDRGIIEERKDGPVPVRARTGAVIGSDEDKPVTVVFADREGQPHRAVVRAGVLCIAERRADGMSEGWTLARMLRHQDYSIGPDGILVAADGRRYNATPWPGGTPFDAPVQHNWVVSLDGAPFTPSWIASLQEGDRAEAVNEASYPASWSRSILSTGLNRKERRRFAALHVVKKPQAVG